MRNVKSFLKEKILQLIIGYVAISNGQKQNLVREKTYKMFCVSLQEVAV